MERSQASSNWLSKAVVFSLSSAVGGLGTGVALGVAGSLIPPQVRTASGSLLAIVAIVVGGLELTGRHLRPPQCDRETPQRWVHAGPLRWALRNGLALGCGAATRLGFWLWYAIPAGALLAGRLDLGAAIYGTYGAARGVAVWGIILVLARRADNDITGWLVGHRGTARIVAAAQLVFLGVTMAIVMGV